MPKVHYPIAGSAVDVAVALHVRHHAAASGSRWVPDTETFKKPGVTRVKSVLVRAVYVVHVQG
jgi:hypothetical protein